MNNLEIEDIKKGGTLHAHRRYTKGATIITRKKEDVDENTYPS